MKVLDDGAVRFVDSKGQLLDRIEPECPGDASKLPTGKFEECWRGGRMDMDLAVDAPIQRARRSQGVPAGT